MLCLQTKRETRPTPSVPSRPVYYPPGAAQTQEPRGIPVEACH